MHRQAALQEVDQQDAVQKKDQEAQKEGQGEVQAADLMVQQWKETAAQG